MSITLGRFHIKCAPPSPIVNLPNLLRFIAALLFLFSAPIYASPATLANEMVHKKGMEIVDGSDRPLRFVGISTGGWFMWEGWIFGKGILLPESKILSGMEKLLGKQNTFQQKVYDQFFTEADFALMQSMGFNSVRIPINHRLLEDDENPYVYKEEGWRRLDFAVDCCERHNLYAILDFHALPGGQSRIAVADPDGRNDIVWRSPENQKRAIALWKAIAQRYRGRRCVAGYDLINEPMLKDGHELVDLCQRIIAAIRSVDPDHMLIVEGNKMATDFSAFDRALDPNQVYSFHMYTWFGDNRASKLAEYKAIALRQQIPFWCGEFGENTYPMIESTVSMYKQSAWIIGYCYWTWRRAPSRFPGLVLYDVPPSWMKTIRWINWPRAIKPRKEQVEESMNQFFQAVQLQNCHVDQQMVKILTGRW